MVSRLGRTGTDAAYTLARYIEKAYLICPLRLPGELSQELVE